MITALFILLTSYFLHQYPANAFEIDRTKSVSITASIDETRVIIFGFTSPLSRVELSNSKVYDITYSRENGYFIFDRVILPKEPGELCLSSTDDNQRHTNPTCLPPLPPKNYTTSIGPIILAPTLTVNESNIKADSTVAASGQSIPFSTIDVFLYQVDNNPSTFVKPARAFSLPLFSTKTDGTGNYELSIPTSYSSNYRLFSTVQFATLPSPKSNTIFYTLPTIFDITIFVPLFIISLILFLYLLYLYYSPKTIRYLPAIYKYPLSIRYKSNFHPPHSVIPVKTGIHAL